MSDTRSVVDQGIDACNFSVYRDEKECRLWIECLEKNLVQARASLDRILLEKPLPMEAEEAQEDILSIVANRRESSYASCS